MVFPREPFIKVIAPIMEAQLVETAILKYPEPSEPDRHKGSPCLLCSTRATVSWNSACAVPRDRMPVFTVPALLSSAAAVGTSNVLAGQIFDVPVKGTHAHSWIMSFPDEYTAFKTYAELYPNACILLVDTYDTLKSGVPNAIRVFQEMKDAGIALHNYGIRLDSGDLAYLSKKARQMLDTAGFPDAIISASNDLDEYLIEHPEDPGCKNHLLGCRYKPDHLQRLPGFRRCIQTGCHPQ